MYLFRSKVFSLVAIVLFSFAMGDAASAQGLRTEIVSPIASYTSKPAFTPDGRYLAFAGGTGATLWDIEKRRLLRTFTGLDGASGAVAISPDGKRVASGAGTKLIIWDLETGAALRSFDLRLRSLNAIVFTNDGSRIVYTGDASSYGKTPRMFVRDADTGEVIRSQVARGPAQNVVTSKVTGQIAYGDGSGTIFILDPSGRQMRTIAAHNSGEAYNPVSPLVYSPDGTMLASGGTDRVVKIWNTVTGKLLKALPGHDGNDLRAVYSLSWSADGRTLVTWDKRRLRFWKMPSGELGKSEVITAGSASRISVGMTEYMPDGKTILFDEGIHALNNLQKIGQFGSSNSPEIVRGFSEHASDVLIASTPFAIHRLNVVKGELTKLYESETAEEYWSEIRATANGRQIIGILGGSLMHLSLDGKPRKKVLLTGPSIAYTAISAGGEKIAVSSKGQVQIIDGNSHKLLHRIAADADWSPSQLAFGAGGSVLLADLKYETLSAIDTTTGSKQQQINFDNFGDLIASPDGKSFAVSNTGTYRNLGPALRRDYTIDIWRFEGPNRLRQMILPSAAEIVSEKIAFNASGTILAAGGFESLVRLWDLRTGQVTKNLVAHTRLIEGMEFVANSSRLVSVGTDGLRIWNTATSELLASYSLLDSGEWVAISPEGFFDSSSRQAAEQISVVRGLESYSIDQVYQALYRPDLVREKLVGDPNGLVREAAAKLDLNKVIASGAAPRVTIVTKPGSVSNDEVTIEASIAEQNGGGIGRIEWRVNGVTLGVESLGLEPLSNTGPASSDAARPPAAVKRTLALEPGDNKIEVVAYNGRDLIASEPAQIVLKWDGEKSAGLPKLHVLAVGVNDYYDSRLRLSYAVPDAKALGEALQKAGAAMYQSVEVTSVLDSAVTADNLDRVFAEVSRKVHPRDVFVFFLAGHGKTVDGRYHFLPQNFRYEDETSIVTRGIGQERFQGWFATIPARKSILLYDTCESGSLTGERVAQRGIERVAALEKMTRAMGRTVLSASSDDAPALEGYRGHGVFTYALLDGLQGADTNGNGLIEVTELAAYIDQQVPDLSYQAFKMRQIPQMKIVGNSFPVVNKTAVLKANATPAPPIPTRPTHVIISPAPAEIFAEAARGGVIDRLNPGTAVALIETVNGWTLIARDGKQLGYVQPDVLLKLQ